MMNCGYEKWLEWFIRDHKLDIADTLVDEIIGGVMVKMTMNEFFNKTYKMTQMQQEEIQEALMVRSLTGEPIREYLRKRCIELIEYEQSKTIHKPTHFWEE